MNRLTRRPWFVPGLAAVLYLTGFNDEVLALVGSAWLALSRQVQTVVVVGVLVVAGFLLSKAVRERQSAYRAAVRAATVHDHTGSRG